MTDEDVAALAAKVELLERSQSALAARVAELAATKMDQHAVGALFTSLDLRLQDGIKAAATTTDGVDEDLKPLPPMPVAEPEVK